MDVLAISLLCLWGLLYGCAGSSSKKDEIADVVSGEVAAEDTAGLHQDNDLAAQDELTTVISSLKQDQESAQKTVAEGMTLEHTVESSKDSSKDKKLQGLSSQASGLVHGASGEQAAEGLPELGSKMHYFVKPGDTLGKIAKNIYGHKKFWKTLAKASAVRNPNLIYPGDIVYYQLTKQTMKFATSQDRLFKQSIAVVVKKGDDLQSIAKKIYGSSRAWKYLWRQNMHIQHPDRIYPGAVITAETLTQTVKVQALVYDSALMNVPKSHQGFVRQTGVFGKKS
jgi:nucleoid-associated protein YgaU